MVGQLMVLYGEKNLFENDRKNEILSTSSRFSKSVHHSSQFRLCLLRHY